MNEPVNPWNAVAEGSTTTRKKQAAQKGPMLWCPIEQKALSEDRAFCGWRCSLDVAHDV